MSQDHSKLLLALLAIVLVALAACGKRGDLDRPEPMWKSAPTNPAPKAP